MGSLHLLLGHIFALVVLGLLLSLIRLALLLAGLSVVAQSFVLRFACRPQVLLKRPRERVHITPMSGLLLVHSVVLPVLGAAHLGRLRAVAAHKRLELFAHVVVSDLLAEVRANGGTKFAVGRGLRLVTQEPRRCPITRLLVLNKDGLDSHYLLVGQPDT